MEDQIQQTPNVSEQPVNETQPVENKSGSSKKMVLALCGFVALAVVILAGLGYYYFRNSKPNYSYNNQYSAQANPTVSQSPAVSAAPTQVTTVSSATDLNSVMSELNSTTDKDLQNDYNQANSEGNNF